MGKEDAQKWRSYRWRMVAASSQATCGAGEGVANARTHRAGVKCLATYFIATPEVYSSKASGIIPADASAETIELACGSVLFDLGRYQRGEILRSSN